MNALKCAILLIFSIFISTNSWANGAIIGDSLRQVLNQLDTRAVLVFANKTAAEDHDLALYAYDIAIQKAVLENQPLLLISSYRDKGIFWEDLGSLDSADIFYQKALKQAEKCQNEVEIRNLFNDLAIVARKDGRYNMAKEYHLQALEKATQNKDEELVEFSWHGLGYLYEMVGDNEQSLKYYRKSFEAAEKRGHQNGMVVTLGNLAEVFAASEKTNEAIIHIKHGLELATINRDSEQLAQSNFIYGDILEQAGQFCTAEEHFLTSIEWSNALHDKISVSEAYIRLGNLAEREHNFPHAIECYNIALQYESLIPPNLMGEACLNLGRIALQTHDFDKANRYFQQSHKIAQDHKLPDLEMKTSLALHDWCFAQKMTEKSLFYLERSQFIRDSTAQVLRAQGSAELSFRYDLEKNKRNLEALEIKDNRIRTLLVLLIGLIGACAMTYMIWMRKKANKILRSKNDSIRDQNQRLEESNKLLHQFTYAVAHDLKEPLRSISSFITLLERRHGSHFTGDGIEYMRFVQTGVKRMNALIGDLLAFSNISSQRAGAELVNSSEVLQNVISQLKNTIEEKNGSVICQNDLPKVKINANHLGFLFQNLIQNALKFNDSERPTVKVNASLQGDKILFSIEDNGIGIEQVYSDKIFDLFNQLHKNKSYTGTGIGLTVCKNIVDKYNGRIWFESAAEKGTRFWVSLPI
jgi:signal transduction histidine kinase